MGFYVYIIQSQLDGRFYKGFSEHPLLRLTQHNQGQTQSTKPFIPWVLVYVEQLPSKASALQREKNLKKATRQRILSLLSHPKNMVHLFK